jgi:hypothetical protein
MLLIQLRGSGGIVVVIAFFDDGSNITPLDFSIAVKQGLEGVPIHLYAATGRVI